MTDKNDTDDTAERIAASVREQLETDDSSRRSFLTRSAVAGGALLALGGGTGLALAGEHGEDGTEKPMGDSFDDVSGTDLDVLNYALSLEHLEYAFYQEGLEMFDESAFMESEALQPYPETLRKEVYAHVEAVAAHEQTHVDVITQAVELLGGDPSMEQSYDFGFENVGDFLALARVFENTGVAAYAGAASYIESPDLLNVAVSIHSVEARHAALFNMLNGQSPFPDAFDEAMSQEEVLSAVSPFIQSAETETDDETEATEADDETEATETDETNETEVTETDETNETEVTETEGTEDFEGTNETATETSTEPTNTTTNTSTNNTTGTDGTAVDEGASDPGTSSGKTNSTDTDTP